MIEDMENNPVDINKYGHGMRSQSKRASVAEYKANYSTLENSPGIQPSEADFDLMAFGNELDGNGIPLAAYRVHMWNGMRN